MTTGLAEAAGPARQPPSARSCSGQVARLVSPAGALALAALAYAAVCLAMIPLNMAMNWDEIVYTSQLGIDQVPMPWGGHRAWGAVVLMAPVAVLTKSVVVLRAYLVILAGLAMFVAFRPWISVLGQDRRVQYVPAFAAVVFGAQWLTVLNGPMGFPNVWLAFALIAGTGFFLTSMQRPSATGPLAATVASFTAAALLRPTDAIAAATPILLTLLIRGWRAPRAVGAVGAGLALGAAPWVIEAFVRFGGPIERLQSSRYNAGAGYRLRFVEQLYASDGPYTLCSTNLCNGVSGGMAIWWIALPVVAIIGTAAARRRGAFRPMLLALASAAFFSGPYFTIVGGSHPRFLIPAYGLLALGAAYALLALIPTSRPAANPARARRPIAVAVVLAAMLFQIAVHYTALERVMAIQNRISKEIRTRMDTLVHEGGVAAPCLMYGQYAVGLSYDPGCDRIQTIEPPCPSNESIDRALADGAQVVLVFRDDIELCEPYTSWRRLRLQENGRVYAFLSPT